MYFLSPPSPYCRISSCIYRPNETDWVQIGYCVLAFQKMNWVWFSWVWSAGCDVWWFYENFDFNVCLSSAPKQTKFDFEIKHSPKITEQFKPRKSGVFSWAKTKHARFFPFFLFGFPWFEIWWERHIDTFRLRASVSYIELAQKFERIPSPQYLSPPARTIRVGVDHDCWKNSRCFSFYLLYLHILRSWPAWLAQGDRHNEHCLEPWTRMGTRLRWRLCQDFPIIFTLGGGSGCLLQ